MCILVVAKKNYKIKNKYIKECIKNNPDGTGIGYFVGDKQIIVKIGKKPLNEAYNFACKQLAIAYKETTSDIIFHCRIATGSLTDEVNSHPFSVNDNIILAHNGILNELPSFKKISDTRMLCFLLKNNLINKEEFTRIVGKNNKVVLMTKKRTTIINEELGEWKDNIWFSNSSYKSYDLLYGENNVLSLKNNEALVLFDDNNGKNQLKFKTSSDYIYDYYGCIVKQEDIYEISSILHNYDYKIDTIISGKDCYYLDDDELDIYLQNTDKILEVL